MNGFARGGKASASERTEPTTDRATARRWATIAANIFRRGPIPNAAPEISTDIQASSGASARWTIASTPVAIASSRKSKVG
ncbi:MAG: hypothetical protein ACK559_23240, partial [bacterium]